MTEVTAAKPSAGCPLAAIDARTCDRIRPSRSTKPAATFVPPTSTPIASPSGWTAPAIRGFLVETLFVGESLSGDNRSGSLQGVVHNAEEPSQGRESQPSSGGQSGHNSCPSESVDAYHRHRHRMVPARHISAGVG